MLQLSPAAAIANYLLICYNEFDFINLEVNYKKRRITSHPLHEAEKRRG